MLRVEGLSKRYGGAYALRDATFTLEKGEIVGLLGLNGAGKSTAMNIITGYISPTSGKVSLNGHNLLSDPRYVKRRIGYLPEIPPLYPDMTVGEYLFFTARIKQVPPGQIKAQANAAMERMRLTDHGGKLVRHLSKGYRQRLGVAQALLGDPEVLILDEPGIGLDPLQLAQMREEIRQIGKEQAVLISSHILHEISDICSRVIVLKEGRIAAQDSLGALLRGGTPRLLLRTPERDGLEALIIAIPGVTRLERLPAIEEGCAELRVEHEKGADPRRGLFELFSTFRHPILMLCPADNALEDVFFRLSENSKEG
jgi:ABC-2 type transport system ATP-binding protein